MPIKVSTQTTIMKLGDVKENTSYEIQFFLPTDHLKIKSIKPSCGCTEVRYHAGAIIAVYSSGSIPIHLRGNKVQPIKKITVTYINGREELFYITGTKVL